MLVLGLCDCLSDLIKAVLIGRGLHSPTNSLTHRQSFLKHSLVFWEAEWRGFGYPWAHKGSSGQCQLIWANAVLIKEGHLPWRRGQAFELPKPSLVDLIFRRGHCFNVFYCFWPCWSSINMSYYHVFIAAYLNTQTHTFLFKRAHTRTENDVHVWQQWQPCSLSPPGVSGQNDTGLEVSCLSTQSQVFTFGDAFSFLHFYPVYLPDLVQTAPKTMPYQRL